MKEPIPKTLYVKSRRCSNAANANYRHRGKKKMGAIYILWLRELKRYVRSRVQIVVSLGQRKNFGI